jgi:fatty-acyl-CoA synthase
MTDSTVSGIPNHTDGGNANPFRSGIVGGPPYPRTIVEAMVRAAQVTDRGFTFADEKGLETHSSFASLMTEVFSRAAALQGLRLARGERVGLIVPEHHDFIVTFLAIIAAGLVPVPIYPPLSLAKLDNWTNTTSGILKTSRAALILTVPLVRPVLWSVASKAGASLLLLDDLASPANSYTPVTVGPEEIAFLQFTSGSTAAPRGVMVSHRNLTENCTGIVQAFLDSDGDDIGVSWLPLYHDMGLIGFVLAPLFALCPVVFLATLGFLKRPGLWLDLIHRHRGTVTFAPNFGYALTSRRMAHADVSKWDLSSLRVAGCGGEPVQGDTVRDFAARFAPSKFRPEALLPCYGMAEATLVVTYNRVGGGAPSERIDRDTFERAGKAVVLTGSKEQLEFMGCGSPLAKHAVEVVDETGTALPDRVIGEIELSGPSVAQGYFGDPAATATTFPEGRLRTGDLGYLADGELFVTGRKKDLIIVRGRNYAPQTIEWSVGTLPNVRKGNVVAFGRVGAQGTDEVVIVYESVGGDPSAIEGAIRSRVTDELSLAVGDIVRLPPGALPKTSSGKVQRSRTRQLYLDGTLRTIAARQANGRVRRALMMVRVWIRASVGRLRYAFRRGGSKQLALPPEVER